MITSAALTSPSFSVDDSLELGYEAIDDDGDTVEVQEVIWMRNGVPLEEKTN